MPLGPGGVAVHSIQVPAPHDADPIDLRRAAVQVHQCADRVHQLRAGLQATVIDLTQGGGQWRGPIADVFQTQAWAPIETTLRGLSAALERTAASLLRAATVLEEAQSERRKAEALAVAAGVGVALTVLSFGLSDGVAAEAAASAAVLMGRAATMAAGALRAVLLELQEAGTAVRVASVTMRTWGVRVASSGTVALPRLAEGPIGAGAFGALSSAAVGDLSPVDIALATALGMVEGRAAQVTAEESPPPPPGLTKAGTPKLFRYYIERFEGVERAHVIDVHCDETAPQLGDRLRFDPQVPASASFRSRATAQEAIQDAIDANQERIATWLKADKPMYLDPPIRAQTDAVLGKVLTREAWELGEGPVDTKNLRVVLRRSSASPLGFVVYTAFPVLKK